MQKICGTDIALYLIWLRYASNFFGAISVMNIGFCIMYYTGDPSKQDSIINEKDGQSLLQVFTILNVSDNKFKVISCFFQSMIIVAGMCLTFIFKYMTKYQEEVRPSMQSQIEYAERENEKENEDLDIDENRSFNSESSFQIAPIAKITLNPADFGC